MQITSIPGQLIDLVSSTIHPKSSTPSAIENRPPDTSAFSDIASRYDLRQITPQQFSHMIAELHDAGAISDEDRDQLAEIRTALDDEQATPDQEIDLFTFLAQRLREQEGDLTRLGTPAPESAQRELQSRIDETRDHLRWIDRLANTGNDSPLAKLDALV